MKTNSSSSGLADLAPAIIVQSHIYFKAPQLSLVLLSIGLGIASAECRVEESGLLENLAQRAVAANPAEARPAIAALRARGPAGLEALLQTYAGKLEEHKSAPASGIDSEP